MLSTRAIGTVDVVLLAPWLFRAALTGGWLVSTFDIRPVSFPTGLNSIDCLHPAYQPPLR